MTVGERGVGAGQRDELADVTEILDGVAKLRRACDAACTVSTVQTLSRKAQERSKR